MTVLSPSEFEDLLPGYVLGILEPDELAAVEATLAAHPEYAARLIPLEQAVALLPYAAPSAPALRPEVKARTLAFIRREARAMRPPRSAVRPTGLAFGAWVRGVLGRGWAPALAAICLALAVGLGAQLNAVQGQLAHMQAQIATLEAANAQREADVAQLTTTLALRQADVTRLTAELSQRQADVDALAAQLTQTHQAAQAAQQQISLVTRASQVVNLAPADPAARNATGRVYVTEDGRAVALVQGLPPAPVGRTYQLWGIGGPNNAPPAPMGTFIVTPQGQAAWEVDAAIVADQFPAFGVTQEPTGGSQTPTLPILLLGQRTS